LEREKLAAAHPGRKCEGRNKMQTVTHQRVKDGFGFVGGQRSQSWPFMTTSMFNSPIKCSLFTLNVVFLLFFFDFYYAFFDRIAKDARAAIS